MPQFYVVDNLRRDELNIAHFDRLRDAVRAYTSLPTANWKALGIQDGGDAVDLIRRVPIRPRDPDGEDVMVLEILEHPMWKSRPSLLVTAQDLASRFQVRYCLFRGCLLPIPTRDALPKRLRDKRLWPSSSQVPYRLLPRKPLGGKAAPGLSRAQRGPRRESSFTSPLLLSPQSLKDGFAGTPEKYETAIHWIEVAGVGRLSLVEFKRRYRTDDAAHSFPLVLSLSVHGQNKNGSYRALKVTPWEFHLLVRRSLERLDQNKN